MGARNTDLKRIRLVVEGVGSAVDDVGRVAVAVADLLIFNTET